MKRHIIIIIFIILVAPPATWAHRVNLFCYAENGTIYGEGFFSQGSPVKNATVQVYDADTSDLIGTTQTDDKGMFSLSVPHTKDLRVVLVASMGHRAEYLLTQEARNGYSPVTENEREMHQAPLDYEKIAEIMHRELQPVRDDLRRLEKKQSAPDVGAVVGGLGWIVGLFSLFYLLRKKNAS